MSATTAAVVVPPVRPTAPMAASPAVVPYRRTPLPLPALAARRTSTVVYGLSSIDNRGRVVDLKIMRHLDWNPGLTLAITEAQGTLTITPDTAGAFQVTSQGTCASLHHCGTYAHSPPVTASSWPPTRPDHG